MTSTVEGHCQIFLDIYPSETYVSPYENSIPVIFTVIVALLFLIMAVFFVVYNGYALSSDRSLNFELPSYIIVLFPLRFVQNRNKKVENAAARSNAIVSSLFPSNVRDLEVHVSKGKNRSKSATNNKENDVGVYKSKPIADLFPETTVLFGDIVGFTAWSSVRDPTQVFTLLETVYHAFDEIAHKRRIFKVETIGDCYVGMFHDCKIKISSC
jgi:hypothetical protein